jgi:hypothetical protein
MSYTPSIHVRKGGPSPEASPTHSPVFPPDVPLFILAQLSGAIVAALTAKWLFSDKA